MWVVEFSIQNSLHEIILEDPHQDCCKETRQKQDSDARVDNRKPMNLKVMRKRRSHGVLIHPLLKRSLRFLSLHSIHKLSINFLILSNIHKGMRIHSSIDLNHTVFIIQNLKLNMLVEEILELDGIRFAIFVNLPNESPYRQIIIVHLEVIVFLNSSSKLLDLFSAKLLFAVCLGVFLIYEVELVWSTNEPVAVQNLT